MKLVVYTSVDRSDALCIIFYDGCILEGVSCGLLMMDDWLIHVKSASSYLIYYSRYVNLFYLYAHL